MRRAWLAPAALAVVLALLSPRGANSCGFWCQCETCKVGVTQRWSYCWPTQCGEVGASLCSDDAFGGCYLSGGWCACVEVVG